MTEGPRVFRNARSAFRNLHVDPLSFIPSLYLYLSKLSRFGCEISVFNTQQGGI